MQECATYQYLRLLFFFPSIAKHFCVIQDNRKFHATQRNLCFHCSPYGKPWTLPCKVLSLRFHLTFDPEVRVFVLPCRYSLLHFYAVPDRRKALAMQGFLTCCCVKQDNRKSLAMQGSGDTQDNRKFLAMQGFFSSVVFMSNRDPCHARFCV